MRLRPDAARPSDSYTPMWLGARTGAGNCFVLAGESAQSLLTAGPATGPELRSSPHGARSSLTGVTFSVPAPQNVDSATRPDRLRRDPANHAPVCHRANLTGAETPLHVLGPQYHRRHVRHLVRPHLTAHRYAFLVSTRPTIICRHGGQLSLENPCGPRRRAPWSWK